MELRRGLAVMRVPYYLSIQETNLSAIVFGTHGEVNPVAPVLVLFDKEFVEFRLRLPRVIKQDIGESDSLLCPTTPNIDGTTCNVVRGSLSPVPWQSSKWSNH